MYLTPLQFNKKDVIPVVSKAEPQELLFYTSPLLAMLHIEAGEAEAVGTKKRIRKLLWTGPPVPKAKAADSKNYEASGPRQTRYSHKHETQTNPQNVWTLLHLPVFTETIFLEVARSAGADIIPIERPPVRKRCPPVSTSRIKNFPVSIAA